MDNIDVNVVKTVYIDNKLKKIYKDFESYSELSELKCGDVAQDFFDQIFPILWTQGELKMTNKQLGERFGYAESTIEKRVRILDRANLIVRTQNSYYDKTTQKWCTTRTITLDPIFSARLSKELSLEPKSKIKSTSEEPVEIIEPFTDDINPDDFEHGFVFRGRRSR